MGQKKLWDKRIRGWLPQTPKLPNRSSPVELPIKPRQTIKKSLTFGIVTVVIASLLGGFLVNQFSTLTIILFITIFFFATGGIIFCRYKRKFLRFFKYATFFVLLVGIVFTGFSEFLAFTSGYPPTYVPQTSYPAVLDAKIAQYFQTVEQSASYRFVQAEHFGTLTFAGFSLHSSSSNGPQWHGWLTWTFYANDVGAKITMGQSEGEPYHTSTKGPSWGKSYVGNYSSIQDAKESLAQIDSLGLRWFYDHAVEAHQNATGHTSTITTFAVDIGFDDFSNYQGLTITLNGQIAEQDSHGNTVYPSVFTVKFEPDGNILSISN